MGYYGITKYNDKNPQLLGVLTIWLYIFIFRTFPVIALCRISKADGQGR